MGPRREVSAVDKTKKYKKPEMKCVESYMKKPDYHCHQVKDECFPYQMKA